MLPDAPPYGLKMHKWLDILSLLRDLASSALPLLIDLIFVLAWTLIPTKIHCMAIGPTPFKPCGVRERADHPVPNILATFYTDA